MNVQRELEYIKGFHEQVLKEVHGVVPDILKTLLRHSNPDFLLPKPANGILHCCQLPRERMNVAKNDELSDSDHRVRFSAARTSEASPIYVSKSEVRKQSVILELSNVGGDQYSAQKLVLFIQAKDADRWLWHFFYNIRAVYICKEGEYLASKLYVETDFFDTLEDFFNFKERGHFIVLKNFSADLFECETLKLLIEFKAPLPSTDFRLVSNCLPVENRYLSAIEPHSVTNDYASYIVKPLSSDQSSRVLNIHSLCLSLKNKKLVLNDVLDKNEGPSYYFQSEEQVVQLINCPFDSGVLSGEAVCYQENLASKPLLYDDQGCKYEFLTTTSSVAKRDMTEHSMLELLSILSKLPNNLLELKRLKMYLKSLDIKNSSYDLIDALESVNALLEADYYKGMYVDVLHIHFELNDRYIPFEKLAMLMKLVWKTFTDLYKYQCGVRMTVLFLESQEEIYLGPQSSSAYKKVSV